MTFSKALGVSAALGGAVPVLLRGLLPVVEASTADPYLHVGVQNLALALCPPWILVLTADGPPALEPGLFLEALAANVLLYATAGALVWLGAHRHGAFTAIAVAGLGAIWWEVLTL